MGNSLLSRLGTFFILIGVGLLILFIGALFAREFNLRYFIFASATLLVGILLHRAAPRSQSSRFSTIRKLSQRSRAKREERQIDSKEQPK